MCFISLVELGETSRVMFLVSLAREYKYEIFLFFFQDWDSLNARISY